MHASSYFQTWPQWPRVRETDCRNIADTTKSMQTAFYCLSVDPENLHWRNATNIASDQIEDAAPNGGLNVNIKINKHQSNSVNMLFVCCLLASSVFPLNLLMGRCLRLQALSRPCQAACLSCSLTGGPGNRILIWCCFYYLVRNCLQRHSGTQKLADRNRSLELALCFRNTLAGIWAVFNEFLHKNLSFLHENLNFSLCKSQIFCMKNISDVFNDS